MEGRTVLPIKRNGKRYGKRYGILFEHTDTFKCLENKGQSEIVLKVSYERCINVYIFFRELLYS